MRGTWWRPGKCWCAWTPASRRPTPARSEAELEVTGLQLRRIDAELGGTLPEAQADDDPTAFEQVLAQYRAHRQAHLDALASERAAMSKAEQDLMRARREEAKLRETLPIFEEQERAWKQLVDEGFAGRLQADERKRQRIETEQELKAQAHTIAGARASMQQSQERIAQLESTYRQELYSERVETLARHQTAKQEWEKQAHRNELLELKAPYEGIIKDLATTTEGAVLQPGTVLMTIVPANEPLRAEVWVDNRDRGFVHEGQKVKVKVAPYPFQKYGMVDGVVKYVSADANESQQRSPGAETQNGPPTPAYQFRSIVELAAQALETDGARHKLMPGMQVDAEISLGERTVMEYLLSPVRKAFHEAGRER